MSDVIYWYVILGMAWQSLLLWTGPEHFLRMAKHPRWTLFFVVPIVVMCWPLFIWWAILSLWKDA